MLFAVTLAVQAQEGQREEEITTDFGTDEYVYIPKMTMNLGIRTVSGPKASFSGQGVIMSPFDFRDATSSRVVRNYHDGSVRLDSRNVLDANGSNVPITSDGKTNSWSYLDNSQLTPGGTYITTVHDGLVEIPAGLIAMHSFAATVTDTTKRSKDMNNAYGMELTVTRDMGKLFNTKASWGIIAGMSVSDLNASTSGAVKANLRTVTDYYSLDGVVPPAAPFSGPTITTQPSLDSNGNQIITSSGTGQTISVDTTPLISDAPLARGDATDTGNTTSVTNHWKLKGSYFTFRVGPTVFVPITEHLNVSFSAGAALVYAGSTYTVTQDFKPTSSDDIVNEVSDGVSVFLPGYYIDANVNYNFTDNAGLYVGVILQGNGSYNQMITSSPDIYKVTAYTPSTSSTYTTRVDLSSLQGIRAGMTYKF